MVNKRILLSLFFCFMQIQSRPASSTFNKYAGSIANGLFFIPIALRVLDFAADNLIGKDIESMNSKVHWSVQQHVRQSLQHNGVSANRANTIRVRENQLPENPLQKSYEKHVYWSYGSSGNAEQFILVPSGLCLALENQLKGNINAHDSALICRVPFHLIREKYHMDTHTDQKNHIAGISIPVALHMFTQKCASIFNRLPLSLKKDSLFHSCSHIARGSLKLLVGLPLKVVAAGMGFGYFKRVQEKKADSFACNAINDPTVLNAVKKHYQEMENKVQQDAQEEIDFTQDNCITSFLLYPHLPRPQDRVDMIEKRIAEL